MTRTVGPHSKTEEAASRCGSACLKADSQPHYHEEEKDAIDHDDHDDDDDDYVDDHDDDHDDEEDDIGQHT